jgi:dTDP-4-amino-4,6-dideoxygalactose transaminase
MITPETSGIVGVHVYSRPCDIAGLQAVADKHGLKLMFDAAHAFGCSYKGQMIGNFGECEVFSFHGTKFFNTFEGGAIATNNDVLAEKIRLMQNFGFKGFDNVIYIGTNGKMSEVCAAMGLVNMDSLDDFLAVYKRNYEAYKTGLAGIRGLKLIEFDADDESNRQYIVVEVGDDYPLSREALIEKLHAENVIARKYFWPGCHRMEPYKTLQPDAGRALPVTEEVAGRIVVLPTGTAVDEEKIHQILGIIA